jgi:hypothetical protein
LGLSHLQARPGPLGAARPRPGRCTHLNTASATPPLAAPPGPQGDPVRVPARCALAVVCMMHWPLMAAPARNLWAAATAEPAAPPRATFRAPTLPLLPLPQPNARIPRKRPARGPRLRPRLPGRPLLGCALATTRPIRGYHTWLPAMAPFIGTRGVRLQPTPHLP